MSPNKTLLAACIASLTSLLTLPTFAFTPSQQLILSSGLSNLERSTLNSSLAYQALYVLAAESADLDGDAAIEAPAMTNVGGAGVPVGGGNIPLTSAAPKSDGYGKAFGYCSWDNGSVTGSANRIAGANNPAKPTLAVIASGPNGVFDTTCANIYAGLPAQDDDVVVAYSGLQMQAGVNSNLFIGDAVPSLAALLSLDPLSLHDGQIRLTKDSNAIYRWSSVAGSWQTVASGVLAASRMLVSDASGLVTASNISHSAGSFSGIVNLTATGNISTTGSVTAPWFNGALNGNSTTATALQVARIISMTGDASWQTTFDGSGNATGVMTLANSGVVAGTYGSAIRIPAFIVDGKGRVTSASSLPIDVVGALGYTPTKSNGDGYSVAIQDTRATNFDPQARNSGTYFDFRGNAVDGLTNGGTYHGVMTFRPYGSTTDFSGGVAHQMAFTETGELFRRNSTGAASWSSWSRILDSTNSPNAYNMNQGVRTGDSPTFAGVTAPVLNINRQGSPASGISWYGASYTAWSDYMGPAGATGQGPGGNITAPSGALVTTWGRRSFIENVAGYGWTWESGVSTGQPAVVAELSSKTGNFRTIGSVTASSFNSHPSYGGSGTLLDSVNQPYAVSMNQHVRTTDAPTFADVYTNGWFRLNSANIGIYNQATATHWYSETNGSYTIAGSGTNNAQIIFRDSHMGTRRGYVYSDAAGFGLLNSSGSWAVRANAGGANSGGSLFGTWDSTNLTVSGSQVLHAANFNSYAVKHQDGARYSTDFNSLLTSGFYNAASVPANAPGAYGQLIVAKGIDTGLQIYGGYNNDNLWFRGWSSSGAAFTPWRAVLHAGNFNSYAPTLTGGGASGTWPISISGNAATLGGYAPNQSGGGNTIVQRDANGYIQNSYFYTSGGGSERGASGMGYFAGFNSSDYYIRSYTNGAAAAIIRTAASGTWPIAVTGDAGTVDGQSFNWSNTDNNPTYVWGTNANGTSFLANRASLSVNYANSAGVAANFVGTGGSHIWSTSAGTGYGSAIQMREVNGAGAQGSSMSYAPRLAFHWSGVVASSFAIEASGRIGVFNNPGTAYENFVANQITAAGGFVGNLTGNATTATYATTAGAAYPYRVGGVVMQFNWSGQAGQPPWLWGGSDGTNMYVYNPSNFSVNYANSAGSVPWSGVSGIPASISSYAANMNQYVRKTDAATFAALTVNGNVASSGVVSAALLQVNSVVSSGAGCGTLGQIARDGNGVLYACQN